MHAPEGDGYGQYEVRAPSPFRAAGSVFLTWKEPGVGVQQLRLPLVMGTARAVVAVKVGQVVRHHGGQLKAS